MLPSSLEFTRIADNTDRFTDFAPYVSAVSDSGEVAFQATLRSGETGIFQGNGGEAETVLVSGEAGVAAVNSHPDFNVAGDLCCYGQLAQGMGAVLVRQAGRWRQLATDPQRFARIGPLGPTIEEEGRVAFRADHARGGGGVWVASDTGITPIAEVGPRFGAFQGLPVITRDGVVTFRADLAAGGQGIFVARGNEISAVATAPGDFAELGLFPCRNHRGVVVFSGVEKERGPGIFLATGGRLAQVASGAHGFASFRGALINGRGSVFFFATPHGGELGVYAGTHPVEDRLLGIGDGHFGSPVVSFALNPVSVNDRDQLAIRVLLANGRQLIVRVDGVRVREPCRAEVVLERACRIAPSVGPG